MTAIPQKSWQSPKPYYDDGKGIRIYLGDCREVLPYVSADALVTDPPYGVFLGEAGTTQERETKRGSYSAFSDTPAYLRDVVIPGFKMALNRVKRAAITPGNRNAHHYPEPSDIGVWYTPGRKPKTYHLRTDVRRNTRTFDLAWAKLILKRDNYRCRRCGAIGIKLEAHHIKPYADFPRLRYVLSNGLTLCVACHKRTKTYGWKKMHEWRKRRSAAKRLSQEVLEFE